MILRTHLPHSPCLIASLTFVNLSLEEEDVESVCLLHFVFLGGFTIAACAVNEDCDDLVISLFSLLMTSNLQTNCSIRMAVEFSSFNISLRSSSSVPAYRYLKSNRSSLLRSLR